jgi:rubredoxin
MTHWKCSNCDYTFEAEAPPDSCPSCKQACTFSDVTCYILRWAVILSTLLMRANMGQKVSPGLLAPPVPPRSHNDMFACL